MIRVLQVVKTSDGARWASSQAEVLSRCGVDVHVALPDLDGVIAAEWQRIGATIHVCDLSLPVRRPWKLFKAISTARALVRRVEPDLVHAHFVTNALLLRIALAGRVNIPRLFQVPGPLHLEYGFYRKLERWLSNRRDYWICTSRYIREKYRQERVPDDRLYLSYVSFNEVKSKNEVSLRKRQGIDDALPVVGNVSYMYPPKWYLRQKQGLKRHEDMIAAARMLEPKWRDSLRFLFVGGQWGPGSDYEQELRDRAADLDGYVVFTGRLDPAEANNAWRGLDCALHVPESENCGGVIDPLLHDVPVVASAVGGLPEVIIDGKTGWLVECGNVSEIARALEEALENPAERALRTERGKLLVQNMFDVERTSREIYEIYCHILGKRAKRPSEFNGEQFLTHMEKKAVPTESEALLSGTA